MRAWCWRFRRTSSPRRGSRLCSVTRRGCAARRIATDDWSAGSTDQKRQQSLRHSKKKERPPQEGTLFFFCVRSGNLAHEAQTAGRKIRQVGEDGRQVGGLHTEPGGQRCSVLVESRGGNPAAVVAGVIGTAESQRGESAVDVVAFDGVAKNQLVAAPGVVGAAVGTGLQGAAEFGKSERRDLVGDAEFLGGLVKGGHGLADLGQEIDLLQ